MSRPALTLAIVVLLAACESKFAFPDAEVGASDDVEAASDTAAEADAPAEDTAAPVDVCGSVGTCPAAVFECREQVVFRCTQDASGCAVWGAVEDCAAAGKTCTASSGVASCATADPCAGLQTCAGTIGICEGNTAVACLPNADGCQVVTRTECGPLGQSCKEGGCLSDPCAGKVTCPAETVQCSGSELQTCSKDVDGCLVLTVLEDCATTPGAVCSPGPPARCVGELIGNFAIEVLVDTKTVLPGSDPITTLDRAPALDGDRAAIRVARTPASSPASATMSDAVLLVDLVQSTVSVVVQLGTSLPDAPESVFQGFEALSVNGPHVDDKRVVFIAGGSGSRRGIYASESATLSALVTRTTAMPGTSALFVGLSEPVLATDLVAFNGNDFGSRSGAYRVAIGASTVVALAETETTQPAAAGRFSGVTVGDLTVTEALLVGFGKAPIGASYGDVQRGVYRASLFGGGVQTVVDRTTPVPGRPSDTFSNFQGPLFVGADLVFVGVGGLGAQKPLGPVTYKALYRLPAVGALEPLVDTDTPLPGGTLPFATDAADGLTGAQLTTDGTALYFRGVGTTNSAIVEEGLYRVTPGGDVTRIVDRSTPIAGKTPVELRIGRQSASGGRLVFFARFDDGTEAVVLASPTTPALP
jgi:hypothetical protein